MALTRSLQLMRADVRATADVEGNTSRHSDTYINGLINRAIGALYRLLNQAIPDQRYLSSTTITTVADDSIYDLPSSFRTLISVKFDDGERKVWLDSFEMIERPALEDAEGDGKPYAYRLHGATEIEFLPTPTSEYDITLWYTGAPPQLTGDTEEIDVIDRLDDYIVWRAAQEVLFKDKRWDAHDRLTPKLAELEAQIYILGRSRDANAPGRVVNIVRSDRFGRRLR